MNDIIEYVNSGIPSFIGIILFYIGIVLMALDRTMKNKHKNYKILYTSLMTFSFVNMLLAFLINIQKYGPDLIVYLIFILPGCVFVLLIPSVSQKKKTNIKKKKNKKL